MNDIEPKQELRQVQYRAPGLLVICVLSPEREKLVSDFMISQAAESSKELSAKDSQKLP